MHTKKVNQRQTNFIKQTKSEAEHDNYVTAVVLGRDPQWGCLRTSVLIFRPHMRSSMTVPTP